MIWLRLRGHRPRFTRQLPVGPYILDFACRSAKLAVEIDGSQHAESAGDERRTAFLAALGWRVLRFWNSDVRENADGVVEAILAAVIDDRGPTHPQPLPSREGSRNVSTREE
ncbi:endonuclease domain-containing protein [Sphingomonas sp. 37zxx]|uniref:endonuclease domain-containing protein n=1 Tax=Sphingomonas sp. 37zxx TaxID=1550073 RepID=UPI002F4144EE